MADNKKSGQQAVQAQTDADLAARLKSLKSAIGKETAEIEAAKPGADGLADSDHGTGKAMGLGFRVTSELVANVLVGALIGWQLDKWFDTSPILLLIFLLLGVASGFWNVYRVAMRPTGTQQNLRGK